MNIVTITAFEHELGLIKSGSAAKALGALGAGLTALHGGLKEWDTRAAENRALANTPADRRPAAQQFVDHARKHRLKRLGVNAALAGGSGALVGHYGTKAAVHLTDSMSKKLTENLKPASEHAAKVLSEGFGRGGEHIVNKAKGESKGFLGKLIFGKK